jgi:hypothetical protein
MRESIHERSSAWRREGIRPYRATSALTVRAGSKGRSLRNPGNRAPVRVYTQGLREFRYRGVLLAELLLRAGLRRELPGDFKRTAFIAVAHDGYCRRRPSRCSPHTGNVKNGAVILAVAANCARCASHTPATIPKIHHLRASGRQARFFIVTAIY